jgi:hypothetical protein
MTLMAMQILSVLLALFKLLRCLHTSRKIESHPFMFMARGAKTRHLQGQGKLPSSLALAWLLEFSVCCQAAITLHEVRGRGYYEKLLKHYCYGNEVTFYLMEDEMDADEFVCLSIHPLFSLLHKVCRRKKRATLQQRNIRHPPQLSSARPTHPC